MDLCPNEPSTKKPKASDELGADKNPQPQAAAAAAQECGCDFSLAKCIMVIMHVHE